MKKKMTVEDLAVMVKRGFDETAKRVDMVTRFEEMETRFDETATKVDVVRLEKEIAQLSEDISHLGRLPTGIERRLDRVEDDLRLVKTKVGIR